MQKKKDDEIIIEKGVEDEILHPISTNCTIDEISPPISFPLDISINEQLFESDYWDDYLSDSETDYCDNFNVKDKVHPTKRVWNDNLERSCGVCNYIENYTELSNMIKCEGYCRKPYHLKCVGLEELPNTRWKCQNCINNLVFCNICNSFSNKSSCNFLKCYHPICMRFFHTQCLLYYQNNIIWTFNNSCGQKCVAPDENACMHPEINIGGKILKKIFGTENVNEEEVTSKLLNEFGFKFICDRHYCSSCSDYNKNKRILKNETQIEISRKKRVIFKLDDPDDLFYCIKCNSGYHSHCLHPDSIKLVNGVCICYKHIHDQSDMILGRYNIKDEIDSKLKIQLQNCLKSKNGKRLNKELKLALIQKIVNHLESSEFNLNSLPFQLPGQSKDWLCIEIENLINEHNLKYESQKAINFLQNYGFTHIRRNIYLENINDSQDEEFETLSDTGHSGSKNKQKKEKNIKNNQNLKKKISTLNKKDKIFNEKCVCKTICEKDTCQNAAMFIECNSNICGLDEGIQKKNCMNRIFNSNNNKFLDNQKKIILKNLKVIDAGEKGFGITTNMTIPKDTFIIEYVGEILTRENYLKRVEKYKERELESRKKSIIMDYYKEDHEFNEDFVLPKDTRERHWYCMEIGNDYIIDSTNKGNLSRLINHSCDPNCIAQKWLVGNECRVGIFSKREILPNEELTYDYSFTAFDIGFKCKCNSPSCKGRIGIENFKETNQELIKKRNLLCKNTNMINSFTNLNKSLFNNPICSEIDEIFTSRYDYINDNPEFYHKLEKYCDKISKYNQVLHDHVTNGIQIYPYDFKFRNSLYGYTSLLYFDSPDIISDWYFKKSKNIVLMNKPWIILPFAFNSREFTYLKYPLNMNYLKKQVCKRLTISLDKSNPKLSNNSIFWHLFDLGIGSDECCNICNNPGTLITCDYCYDSFHKYCLYNNEIPNNLKRSRLSYNYNKVEEKIKCRNCMENELISVYWLKTTYKRRRYNYFLRHKLHSIPLYINRINPLI
ncbi:protein with 4 PHD domains plus a SET domain and associated cysteine cluster at the C-terminus [Cryptosporidium parvum Iowa II]|uniref:Protein with 4 PHD domains plus a SET domain and associated cysteine cluster at the C-terminus n=2 Tax=Cryptosporidium parvum TaxID=5807 RepID=Q5CS34_CRYPI|nr:protein with 4 PHD domains plus a SET domain and associated cysteine cluster at the C-terminus [Cryptosporidium parvum Iowa II]EAK88172.1 protein with 4 PHD domains plus a SET domain and associated cysteine cluster at the C-terminus [Cryptosporidium parvum Iowa II]QOY41473.1 Histone-lysine N-methyltransferase [Cryptosporidium parvum]WKS77693.1 PHD domain-containing protein [Cryptosporidium sp. 43IA8]WRK32184.1 Histone-lysine N-methyltransferase [Cryptosporidium parvum]|eukprot:QOY41473.1 hypothetical protein CPATCC_002033 [Cryptosporidium parvum]